MDNKKAFEGRDKRLWIYFAYQIIETLVDIDSRKLEPQSLTSTF